MASSINAANPTEGVATTGSVRDNFLAAKTEIEALQTGKADLAGPTFTGTANFATIDVATFNIDGVELTAAPATLNGLDGRVAALEDGIDMADLVGAVYAAGDGSFITGVDAASVDGLSMEVVASLPGTPDANTIYFVTS